MLSRINRIASRIWPRTHKLVVCANDVYIPCDWNGKESEYEWIKVKDRSPIMKVGKSIWNLQYFTFPKEYNHKYVNVSTRDPGIVRKSMNVAYVTVLSEEKIRDAKKCRVIRMDRNVGYMFNVDVQYHYGYRFSCPHNEFEFHISGPIGEFPSYKETCPVYAGDCIAIFDIGSLTRQEALMYAQSHYINVPFKYKNTRYRRLCYFSIFTLVFLGYKLQ